MKVSKRTVLKTFVGLLVAFALGLVFLYIWPYMKFIRLMKVEVEKEQQRKVRLLSDTDHQALLEACRELSRRVSAGDLEPGGYLVRYKPHPETSRFPQLILDLEPMRITVKIDRSIMVEMHGGYHHYGVIAYPENFEKPSHSFKYGDKKIIDGLWYYEDGYKTSPEYQKKIEKLIQKGKMRQVEINTDSANNSDNSS